MRFQDIPPLTQSADYAVDIGLDYLVSHYTRYVINYGLEVNPDFQRNYVWTTDQKIRFVEYLLRGGMSGRDIYCNCPTWRIGKFGPSHPEAEFVLVDGKQRLDAALGFLNNEIPAFGHYFNEFTDRPRIRQGGFRWHVNDLPTRQAVLQWYLDLNSGGTAHTEAELSHVRALMAANEPHARPSIEEIRAQGRLDRKVIQDYLVEEVAKEEASRAARLAAEEAAAKAPKTAGKKRKR